MAAGEPIVAHRKTVPGSERTFGLVFAAVFVLIGLWPLIHAHVPRWWALIVALLFAAAGLLVPALLRPLNRAWFKFGLLLHHIINPVIMAVMFYGAFVPMGLLLKLFGKDLLRLRRDPQLSSYWITRQPPGPPPGSMTKQF